MRTINILEAAASFEELMTAIEAGQEQEIIITKNGRPLAKFVPVGVRLGVAKGKFQVSDDFDALDAQVTQLFVGDSAIELLP
jgi:prevent-host-death family protein